MIASSTRVTDLSKSLTDVILASHSKQFFEAGVIDCSIGDNDMVFPQRCLKVP